MKNWIVAFQVIDFISVGILLTAVAMNVLRRLESCVRAYMLNSWLLSLLFVTAAVTVGETHLYIASLSTLAGKGFVIPLLIMRLVRRLKVTHDVEPLINNPFSLIISGTLVVVVYTSLREGIFVTGFSLNVFKVSIAVILISLFIMISKKKAVTQVIGLLFMENGLFLAGFSLTYGMPTIIELGMLFDLLMCVIILGVFAVQIKRLFASTDLDRLTVLRG